mgnify:CR=1 FL=1
MGIRGLAAEHFEGDGKDLQEILSVVDVPPGKMGRIIGKQGASILRIRESCK